MINAESAKFLDLGQKVIKDRKMSKKDALVVLSRLPRTGHVKKRLSREIGEKEARKIFDNLFLRCLKEMSRLRVDLYLYLDYLPSQNKLMREPWGGLVGQFHLRRQEGNDLGERIKHAFKETFLNGAKNVVLVGSDVPGLKSGHVIEAFQGLSKGFDMALGPCIDGGYYLVALKASLNGWEALFDHICWGTSSVMDETTSRIDALGLRCLFLDRLFDIDTLDDLILWKGQGG